MEIPAEGAAVGVDVDDDPVLSCPFCPDQYLASMSDDHLLGHERLHFRCALCCQNNAFGLSPIFISLDALTGHFDRQHDGHGGGGQRADKCFLSRHALLPLDARAVTCRKCRRDLLCRCPAVVLDHLRWEHGLEMGDHGAVDVANCNLSRYVSLQCRFCPFDARNFSRWSEHFVGGEFRRCRGMDYHGLRRAKYFPADPDPSPEKNRGSRSTASSLSSASASPHRRHRRAARKRKMGEGETSFSLSSSDNDDRDGPRPEKCEKEGLAIRLPHPSELFCSTCDMRLVDWSSLHHHLYLHPHQQEQKKQHGRLTCPICPDSGYFYTKEDFKHHLDCKSHLRQLDRLNYNMRLPSSSSLSSSREGANVPQQKKQTEENLSRTISTHKYQYTASQVPFSCSLCQIGINGIQQVQSHYLGKKHQLKMTENGRFRFTCQVCRKGTTFTKETFNRHINDEDHLNRLENPEHAKVPTAPALPGMEKPRGSNKNDITHLARSRQNMEAEILSSSDYHGDNYRNDPKPKKCEKEDLAIRLPHPSKLFCSTCDMRLVNWSSLNQHLYMHLHQQEQKKQHDRLTCPICPNSRHFHTQEDFKHHLDSKSHRQQLNRLISNMQESSSATEAQVVPTLKKKKERSLDLALSPQFTNKFAASMNTFDCTLCQTTISGIHNVQSHYLGKRHQSNIAENGRFQFTCHVCCKSGMFTQDTFNQHINDKDHLKRLQAGPAAPAAPGSGRYSCRMCNVPKIDSAYSLHTHYVGKKHQEVSSSSAETQQVCQLCGTGFNEPKTFNKHLQRVL